MHHRHIERAQLKRKLEQGISIHMPAPRRIGKTWTINRLATDLRDAGWIAVEIDVEGIETPEDFAKKLCQQIEEQLPIRERLTEKLRHRFTSILGGQYNGTPLDALAKVNAIEFAETLIASLNEAQQNTVILVDEIAYFYLMLAQADAKKAHTFAYQMRALQQRYRNVRWLLTGSIGLNTIARRYGIEGAFVDFETYILEPFTPEQALSYVRDPRIQQQFNHLFDADDATFHAMFDDLGWLAPFYLKLIANEVRPSAKGADGISPRATVDDFKAAFEKLLRPNRKSEFAVWPEHINKNLPKNDRDIALYVLETLSQHVDGETTETLLAGAQKRQGSVTKRQVRDVLDMLYNDGLITLSNERYCFRSGLIRRYWKEYGVE
ncbi:AAA-like domain-containing protein [Niveispirillum sp. KHB5.9]|uniref:AAA-like domain-containing protein n=1 Tax=Niveispirillum sp. KHB5.9 TaxID=3400269 RepID=UPI003A89367C